MAKYKLEKYIDDDEEILWEGKPDNSIGAIKIMIFILLATAILGTVFLCIDITPVLNNISNSNIEINIQNSDEINKAAPVIIFIILLNLLYFILPFIIFVIFAILAFKYKFGNLKEYIFTDKAIYTFSFKNFFSNTYDKIPYSEISNIKMHQSLIEKAMKIGSLIIYKRLNQKNVIKIESVKDYKWLNDIIIQQRFENN